jgi:hypothetical protein
VDKSNCFIIIIIIWKTAAIVTVFIRGNHASMSNYRPISILDNFSKLLEFVIHDYVLHYTKFNPIQCGITRIKSIVTDLVMFLDLSLLLSSVSVKSMLRILIFEMLSTLSLIIYSCIN